MTLCTLAHKEKKNSVAAHLKNSARLKCLGATARSGWAKKYEEKMCNPM